MDFSISKEDMKWQQIARNFVFEELIPLEPEVLRSGIAQVGGSLRLPGEIELKLETKCVDIGLWGLDVPKELGGKDISDLARMLVVREWNKTITPFELRPFAANLPLLHELCKAEQVEKYLTPYIRGDKTSFWGLTEPTGGSDLLGAVLTTAVRQGDYWAINGTKIYLLGADSADFGIILTRTEPDKGREGFTFFLVDKDTPGMTIKTFPVMWGHLCRVDFNECKVSSDNILGPLNGAYRHLQARLGLRRLIHVAEALGMADRALDLSIIQSKERETFGQPIGKRQAIQWKLVDMKAGIFSTESMLYNVLWRYQQGLDLKQEQAIVKLHASEMAIRTIDDAMQIHGARGFSDFLPLETMYRKARRLKYGEGSTEIMRHIIANELLKH